MGDGTEQVKQQAVRKRWRATMTFPSLNSAQSEQVAEGEGTDWCIALGALARQIRRRPELRGRRISELTVLLKRLE